MTDSLSTPFSTLVGRLQKEGDAFTVTLPDDWLQGRTAYGGLTAALCLEATLRSLPSDLPPLRTAQLAFVGPATGALQIKPVVLRSGRSTVFAAADLSGEDGLATRATFCFGQTRPVDHDHPGPTAPVTAALESLPEYFGWPRQPTFMSHFEGRLAGGSRPQTPGALPEMLVWLRHRDRAVDGSMVSLLAMADALPPAAVILFNSPTPLSTMTWTIDVLDPDFHSDSGWWLVHCVADTAQGGYSAQHTTIWSPDGRPVAMARQHVAVFPRRP